MQAAYPTQPTDRFEVCRFFNGQAAEGVLSGMGGSFRNCLGTVLLYDTSESREQVVWQ